MQQPNKVPKLRFPEFTGEWRQSKLKDVVRFSRGQGLSWADVDDIQGRFDCILYGNLYTDYSTVIDDVKPKVPELL